MAQAVVTLTLNNPLNSVAADETKESEIINGIAALTAGGTYLLGGLPLPWTAIKGPNGIPFLPQSNQTTPYLAYFESVSGSGYIYGWNMATNTLQIFQSGAAGAPLAQLGTGVVPAADTILFQAFFKKA
jgi:hypothetical protein